MSAKSDRRSRDEKLVEEGVKTIVRDFRQEWLNPTRTKKQGLLFTERARALAAPVILTLLALGRSEQQIRTVLAARGVTLGPALFKEIMYDYGVSFIKKQDETWDRSRTLLTLASMLPREAIAPELLAELDERKAASDRLPRA